jgi:quercetin dioxygenase-like cupin family protein
MAGISVAVDDLPWETWDDPALAARSAVRWKLIFSGRRTPTGVMSMGLGEIAPGGVLLLHHHAPAEIYHGLEGLGAVEIEGVSHALRAGVSLFIPENARHRATCTGTTPLRFLFVFPTDSFEEITYHFDDC